MAKRAPKSDFDTAWKEVLQRYFETAVAFFFPKAHADVDWSRGFSFEDKELQQAVRRAGRGKRTVDLLARVWCKRGTQTRLLMHVEAQNQPDPQFGQRMFVCNTLLFARDKQPVVSLGILGDTDPEWRPSRFGYDLCGCRALLEFPVVKLLDYQDDEAALERSANPFAIVVVAHLKTQATRPDSETRLQWKLRVLQWLVKQGRNEDEMVDLFRFIDLVMTLSPDLDQRFQESWAEFEEEQKMPFLSNFERKAIARGRREGRQQGHMEAARGAVLDALAVRFKRTPPSVRERVQQVDDPSALAGLLRSAITVGSLAEFEKHLPQRQRAA